MEKYEVIIIGAGASGLMCALNTTRQTLLLEASDRMGKKILATGNGKCNITNDTIDPRFYNTPLVATYLSQCDQRQTLDDFARIGVMTYADVEGRRYPLSNSANSVLDLMLRALSFRRNVTALVNTLPTRVTKIANGFTVTTAEKTYQCQQLVLATGGNSGTQYLQQLGVTYQNFCPSLMALKTTKHKGLAGVRVSNVRVQMGNFDEVGEVLFKDDGISGIVIFNLSAYLARRKITTGQLTLDLLNGVTETLLWQNLQASWQRNPQYAMAEVLEGFLHKSLAKYLLEQLNMGGKLAREVTVDNLRQIAGMIKHLTLPVTGYADNNQVYTGGVDLIQLDEHLQHRQVPGLYVIGEVANVDGVCGGYNLQWAWTSGKIVGTNL